MKFYKIKNEFFFTPKILRTCMQIVPGVSDANTLVDFEVYVVLRYYAWISSHFSWSQIYLAVIPKML